MDCRENLKLLEDNSIDSIVTDPPYELGFMGKKWDSTGIAYDVDLWRECQRVLKPGGHLLAFGGTRTYHRMACAIEDAGFEIRDQIQWIYGSGFPKSHNISKAIDKKFGAKREVIGTKQHSTNFDNALKNKAGYLQDEANRNNTKCFGYGEELITAPSTDEAKQWDGWGTALKPANEPIVVARKPLSEKTIADNVLKWGTGGINIDECRVPYESDQDLNAVKAKCNFTDSSKSIGFGTADTIYGTGSTPLNQAKNCVRVEGRFPANVILDEEAGKMLDEQSGILKSGGGNKANIKPLGRKSQVMPTKDTGEIWSQDSGGASRFFYCAKASKKERGEGNNHPTVKPLSLIKYLITLVTPPEGICLDPFEGSGTHALACKELGFNYIGFELDKQYCEIANKRLEATKAQLTLF